jgi:hypothetical protein
MKQNWINVLAVLIGVSACQGQDRWDLLSAKTARGGIHLYGVSVYSAYSTFSGPIYNEGVAPLGLNVGSDKSYGAQWSLGWNHLRGKTTASISYGGNYGGQLRYSNLNAFGHFLTMSASRTFRTKWSLNASGMADYRTFAQYIFSPTSLSTISQLPGNAPDLAAAFSVGNFNDPQTAQLFSSAPELVSASPLRNLLLADRVLTYGFQASANYAYSSRLNFSFSSISAGGERAIENIPTATVPRTLGVTAGVTFSTSYSLSPRTQIGLGVGETYTTNQFQGSYATNGSLSIGRMMGEHWFMSLHGGMNYNRLTKDSYGQGASRNVIGGGAIGYRLFEHTFIGSYNRASAQMYAIATGLSATAMGAWSWHRPGSGWFVHATGGQYQVRNAGFTSFTGWRANVGFSRALSRQFSMNFEYAFLSSTGNYLNLRSDRTVHSLRVSLRWTPQGSYFDSGTRSPDIFRQ